MKQNFITVKPLLLVDYDGTICFDRFWRSADHAIFAQIQIHLFGADRKMLTTWMRGQLTSEEINQFLARKTDVSYQKLWEVFVHDCLTMRVDPKYLAKIRYLRSRFTTVLMTDNMDCFSRFTVPALQLDQSFDVILNSADHGQLKNDSNGQIFVQTAEAYGNNMKDTWLVDNSKQVCEQFVALGGNACFVDAEHPVQLWLDHLVRDF